MTSSAVLNMTDGHQRSIERLLTRGAVFGHLACSPTVPIMARIWFNDRFHWQTQEVPFGPLRDLRRYRRLVEQGLAREPYEKRKLKRAMKEFKVRQVS